MSPDDIENGQDELMQDSRAAFGLYRPEIKQVPDPMSYKEAVRKYRMHADPHMGEYSKVMRKLGNHQTMLKMAKAKNQRHKSTGHELGKYLGGPSTQQSNRRGPALREKLTPGPTSFAGSTMHIDRQGSIQRGAMEFVINSAQNSMDLRNGVLPHLNFDKQRPGTFDQGPPGGTSSSANR